MEKGSTPHRGQDGVVERGLGGTEKHSSGLRPKPERRAMVMEQDIVEFWLYLLMKTFLN